MGSNPRAGAEGVPTAFISVCLGVLQREPAVQQEVAATIQRFLTSVNWKPTTTKAVAGACSTRNMAGSSAG